jgi:excisionase family DNA binding protein
MTKQRSVRQKPVDGQRGREPITAAKPSAETRARLAQSELLRDPRIRSLWPQLDPREQEAALSPTKAIGHRYPLTSSEVAALTNLSERQIRYWADNGLIPCWRKGRQRLFEAAGLISAYGLARAKQHELQFYRGLIEESVDDLATKVGLLSSVLASRLEDVEPSKAETVTAPLGALTRR